MKSSRCGQAYSPSPLPRVLVACVTSCVVSPQNFSFESIDHDLVSCDCQPSISNGINVVVTGRVKVR